MHILSRDNGVVRTAVFGPYNINIIQCTSVLYIDDTCYSRTRTSFRIHAHFLYVPGGIELSRDRCGRRVRLTVEMGHRAIFIKIMSYYFCGNKTTFVVFITYVCVYVIDIIYVNFFNLGHTKFSPIYEYV